MSNNNGHADGISRRQFLARAGVTVAGMALAGTAYANPDKKIIVGEGDHKYEWVPDWLTPPDNIKWGDTQGVCQDSRGNIYVTHTVHAASPSKDAIVVFDKNGKFLRSWGSRFAGGGHGIDIRKEGREEFAYHCDTAHRKVVKTTLSGDVLWEKGVPLETGVYKKDSAFVPTNVAFSPNGDFYIADGYGSDWIIQYDQKGNYIRTFGGRGKEPGKFQTAHGIWLDERGSEPMLAITDRTGHRIQYYSLDGKFVSQYNDGIRLPCYFSMRGDQMIVADLERVVTLLDKDNKVISMLGDGAKDIDLRGHPRSEFIPGHFIHPHGAKFLHNGDIVVAEYIPIGRMTLLKKIGGEGPTDSPAHVFPD
jgi:hypothetical protein